MHDCLHACLLTRTLTHIHVHASTRSFLDIAILAVKLVAEEASADLPALPAPGPVDTGGGIQG